MTKKNPLNDNGFSLIQSLIAMVITGIVMTAMISMVAIQNNEQKSLSQKLTILDLQRVLISILSDTTICSHQFTQSGLNTFDATKIGTSNPPVINLTTITSQADSNSPAVATVNTPASANDALEIASIQLRNFTITPNANKYDADLVVEMKSTGMVRSLKPIVLDLTLTTTGANPNSQQIVGCFSATPTPSALPAGAVMAFDLTDCPSGWTEYTPAYGRFLRGIDKSGTSIDPSGQRAPGHLQDQGTAKNGLGLNFGTIMTYTSTPGWGYGVNNVRFHDHPVTITSTDPETRPKNTAILYCRKT